jgi:hypothetical protein
LRSLIALAYVFKPDHCFSSLESELHNGLEPWAGV